MAKITWVQALSIVLFVLVVYMILTRIFGHSATDLAITITLFTLLYVNQYHLNREVGEIRITTKQSFEKFREENNLIKQDLQLIKTKLKI